ncbi:hypothetical protein MKW98_026800 [Papaver atlanticum]|uniref:Uncharacterized protein n=1 Tax=Papaver atlanticum TaxID=357466 RepID=A0AAD4X5Q3_9MAGN|nr:hypothetical protein MKW98_026800 [Papaver atlanticum]
MEHQQKRKPRVSFYLSSYSGEPPINFDQPTWELRVAEKTRGARLNCIEVTKMSEEGTIEYHFIPTRSYWLSMVRDDWGTTDDEIKASIASHQMQLFGIEVCGYPIIVISKAVEEYVSPFHHELQGYNFFYFEFDCISQKVAGYVMRSWGLMEDCEKNYCVQCSKRMLDLIGKGKNANKIIPLLDEIFYDAWELERQEDPPCFHLSTTELFRAQAVWHLANLGIDMELRLDEIDEDEELAEILYKDVYGHGTVQELMLLHKFKKKEWDANEQLYLDREMAAEKAGQLSEP